MSEIIDTLTEYTAADVYQMVVQGYYFPMCFVLHAIYVVYNMRLGATTKGPKWYKSLLLGFAMTTGHRYFFAALTSRPLQESTGLQDVKLFLLIWALFNCCPYDLVFRFAHRPVARNVIHVLDQFAIIQHIVASACDGLITFMARPLRVGTTIVFSIAVPMAFDFADRYLFNDRHGYELYPLHYIKRIIIAVICVVVVGPGALDPEIEMFPRENITLVASIAYSLIAVLDIILGRGKPCYFFDYIIPNFWTDFFTYHQGKSPAVVVKKD